MSKPFNLSHLENYDYPWDEVAKVELEATCRNHPQHIDTIQVPRKQWDEYVGGALVQNVFPDLTPDEREIVITQRMPWAYLCAECWNKLGEEE